MFRPPLLMAALATCMIMPGFAYQAKHSLTNNQRAIMEQMTKSTLRLYKAPWGVSALSMVAQCQHQPPIVVYGGATQRSGGKKINKNSIFQIGSISKSFITVVVLQLASANKLQLSDTVSKYFPGYKKWKNITIEQLLNMTSGIVNTDGGSHNIYSAFNAEQYQSYISTKHILDLVYKQPLSFKPGTAYQYANPNYMLLGLLIKKVAHHSAEYEIQKRIINKLSLNHTYFMQNTIHQIVGIDLNNIVHGYDYWPVGLTPYRFQKYGQDTFNFSLSHYNYAGAIISTPSDINRYIHALYTPNNLLSQSAIQQLTHLVSRKNGQRFIPEKSPYDIGYGLGILGMFNKKLNAMLYFYQGQTNGFSFFYIYSPQSQQYLTLAVNTSSNVIDKKAAFNLFYRLNAYCKP